MKWRIRFSVEMDVESSDPDTAEFAQFRYEENYCVGNLIRQLCKEYEEAGEHVCVHCARSEVKLLGPSAEHWDFAGETVSP